VCWFGPSIVPWQSNGLGAHPTSKQAAVEHAVLELVERDSLARVLPQGWTKRAALLRLIDAPHGIAAPGFACFTFDLTHGPLPVAGALLFDLESDVVPLTAGYACRRSLSAAVEAAVLEAAQSRLTEIHGAREDVASGHREGGAALLTVLQRAKPGRAKARRETRALAKVIDAEIAIVTLREAPYVVKAVSSSMLVSELL
jgi:ribosomal protein S12 methylthiotransferase accessory factor